MLHISANVHAQHFRQLRPNKGAYEPSGAFIVLSFGPLGILSLASRGAGPGLCSSSSLPAAAMLTNYASIGAGGLCGATLGIGGDFFFAPSMYGAFCFSAIQGSVNPSFRSLRSRETI